MTDCQKCEEPLTHLNYCVRCGTYATPEDKAKAMVLAAKAMARLTKEKSDG